MRYVLALLGSLLVVGVALGLAGTTTQTAAVDPETATVDRIGDGYAVLLVEGGDWEVDETVEERVVTPSAVPEDGRYEGAVLDVRTGGYVYNETATTKRERVHEKRFEELSRSLDAG